MPKSSTIPGTGISLLKGEKSENHAVSILLSVETLPASNEQKPNLSAKVTLDVETNKYGTTDTDAVTSQVETEQSTVTSQVETELLAQQPMHVETSPPRETSIDTVATLSTDPSGMGMERPTSGSSTNQDAFNSGESGAEKEVTDSPMDTSMQSPDAPKTPVAYLDKDVKTDPYSDSDVETIPNTDKNSQIPVVNVEDNDTGNNIVKQETDFVLSPEKTDKTIEPISNGVVLKIQPLKDIEIDIWSNKVGCYYHFKAEPTPFKEIGKLQLKTSEETDDRPISLRCCKGVDYTPMLISDIDSEVETDRKKPKKYRPCASGPSTLRQKANKHSKLSKTDNTTTPTHSYPIRGYNEPIKASIDTPGSPLPVETDQGIDPESSQVETTDSPVQVGTAKLTEHVETDDSAPHVATSYQVKGTLVTCCFELKKYKRPQRFKCKICGESATSVKDLNAHHRSTHDVQFCDECGKGFSTKSALEKHIYIHKEL